MTPFDRLACAYRNYATEGTTTLRTWAQLSEAEREHYREVTRQMLVARHALAESAGRNGEDGK